MPLLHVTSCFFFDYSTSPFKLLSFGKKLVQDYMVELLGGD